MGIPLAESFLTDLATEYVVALVVAGTLAIAGAGLRWGFPEARPKLLAYRETRRLRKMLPAYLEVLAAYLTHLRDEAIPAFWRTRNPGANVREHVRRHILEPVRGTIPTVPGEEIRVVWFRPDPHERVLRMYEQVGHTPEGQDAVELPIGVGFAGQAHVRGELVESPDCQADARFEPIDKGRTRGSLVCAPIARGNRVTGVLSVMSTCKHAFWLPDFLYFEALAAAIAAIETLEVQRIPAEN